MSPKLRTTILKMCPVALVVASTLTLASSAPGLTLYDGSYSTDLSSSVPGGLAPASGVALAYPTSNLRLFWNQVPGADKYQLQIARQNATNADCSASTAFQLDNIVLTASTSQSEWVPSLSTPEDGEGVWTGAYCWRVRTTGKGYGAWSEAHRFTRTWSAAISGLKFYNDHDGPVPRTSADADFATGDATTRNAGYLTWNDLPGASTYEVEVSSSQSFSNDSIMVTRDGVSDNRVTILHLPDDTYYWRVRGVAPNGTEGGWSSGSNTFTVRWDDPTWSSPERLWPEDASVQSEMRIGWTPMPGASHYEYQVATSGGCFWNPDAPNLAPQPFGEWVKYAAIYDQSDPPNLLSTGDPQPVHCRLSDVRATTMNNWATLDSMIGSEAWGNIATPCLDTQGKVLCEPADPPTTSIPDFGPIYHGLAETPGGANDGRYGRSYDIHWRVRPVYQVSQNNENGWEIGGDADEGVRAYGSWTKYTTSGANRHHKFSIDPTSAPVSSTGTRCEDDLYNVTGECLEHIGSSMQASEVPGQTNDRSMQFPVLTWKPFTGVDGYIVEIARDPLFNNIALTRVVGTGYQQSWAMTESLPDNSEGTGYWWRVAPCETEVPPPGETATRCMPIYASASAGLPLSYGLGGYTDDGVAQTFIKQSAMQVSLSPNFEGASPLVRWTRADHATNDWAGWSKGLEGAQYYELQLAKNPFFNDGLVTVKTTVPRAVPFVTGEGVEETGKVKPIADGLWYYRVRGIDRNGLVGAWSTVATFNKRVEAPVPTGTDGEAGAGVVVGWSAVQGASSYDIEWSDDSGFETKPNAASTRQTMFRIPDSAIGTFYWRVRADVNGVKGQWSSDVRSVRIVPATTLRYGLNRDLTLAGDKIQVTGELQVAGTQTNGQRVRLQRKTGGCDSATGRYVDSSIATTGTDADDGMVNIPAKVLQNTCFRLAWDNAVSVKYSAPIPVKVAPNVSLSTNRKLVRRGQQFCTSMRSNVALNGRMRVQYKNGKAWATTRSATLSNVKSRRVCATITKAGRYPMRVVLDNLTKRSEGWKQFETVTRGSGTIRVNDVWKVVRTR